MAGAGRVRMVGDVGGDVVPHDLGVRIQVPVQAQGVIGCQSAVRGAAVQVHVGITVGNFPGAFASS